MIALFATCREVSRSSAFEKYFPRPHKAVLSSSFITASQSAGITTGPRFACDIAYIQSFKNGLANN